MKIFQEPSNSNGPTISLHQILSSGNTAEPKGPYKVLRPGSKHDKVVQIKAEKVKYNGIGSLMV